MFNLKKNILLDIDDIFEKIKLEINETTFDKKNDMLFENIFCNFVKKVKNDDECNIDFICEDIKYFFINMVDNFAIKHYFCILKLLHNKNNEKQNQKILSVYEIVIQKMFDFLIYF
jgi:hypothetical protein